MRGSWLVGGFLLVLGGCATTAGTSVAPSVLATPPEATAHPQSWPEGSSPAAFSDAATEARITEILQAMTLEQKVGQLIQADISTIEPSDLAKYPLGSILAGGNSGPYGDERSSGADWDRLVQSFRDASTKPPATGVAIPIIFGVDAVHGHSNVPGATIFPHNVGLGAMHDPALVRKIGEAAAAEIAGTGIEWTFAPTLAVPRDLRWGRAYEGFSSDPALVEADGGEMVLGLQGALEAGKPLAANRVAATAKHFLADGGTAGGKDQGDAQISENELVSIHARGYYPAIANGALTVMASFSSWNGFKNHGNRSLLTDVLKDRMGFEGFVVGDWNGHGQIPGCTVTDCPQAINAGLDMFMAPDSWKGLFDNTLREARDGTIPLARIDDAVRRILRVKFKLGLMGEETVRRLDLASVGSPEHLAIAREAVSKSLVLLKNNGSVLPIQPGAKVLVTGPGADNLAMQSGGWTISWQGTDVTKTDFPNSQTIWQAMSRAVAEAGGSASLSVDGSYSDKPDVAIVVFGEMPYAEFQGDVPTLAYHPGNAADLELLKRLKGQGIPVVGLFLSGRPMFASAEINASDAFVAGWLPGTQGDGIADVLVARANGKPVRNFTGRLAMPWPADARSPIEQPLFPLGYGLDYGAPNEVGALSEDPRVDLSAIYDVQTFFDAGRVPAPWSLWIADAGGKLVVGPGEMTSPQGDLTIASADVTAQEDGKALRWMGPASVAVEGPAADLTRQLNNSFVLRIDWRVDEQPTGKVSVAMGGVALDITPLVTSRPIGAPDTLQIPLRCFADAGAQFTGMTAPLALQSQGKFAVTLLGAKAEATGQDFSCPVKAK